MKLPAGLRSLSLRTLVALLATLAMAMAVFSLYLVHRRRRRPRLRIVCWPSIP